MRLSLGLQTTQKLSQTLQMVLNPRMLALLKTLHLPYADLIEKINKEVEENPLLEIEKHDELLEYAKSLKNTAKKEADYDPQALDKDFKSSEYTLAEFLMSQLALENLEELDLKIGEYLINNLDERGYLLEYPKRKQEIMKQLGVKRTHVDTVLSIIQTLEPEGIAARSLKECLLIQITAYNFENEELKAVLTKVVKEHLEDLGKKHFEKIAKALHINSSGVEYIAEFIEKNLNPHPAAGYRNTPVSEYVIPSFIIEQKEDGTFTPINLEKQKGPQINFSQSYVQMLENPQLDEKTKAFLQEKYEAAKQFMENINSRHRTIQRVIDIIASTQVEFFEKGAFMMKPLLQRDLAVQVGVHPSTISRAVSTKYIQTPQGLFSLKFLCPRNHKGFSPIQIKGIIKTIIKEQGKLSDQRIANLLQNRGISIKRRTVAKYRSELGIESSYERPKN